METMKKLIRFCLLDKPHNCGSEIEVLADFDEQKLFYKCKKCGIINTEKLNDESEEELPHWLTGCRSGACSL
jgi:hypothetical protein